MSAKKTHRAHVDEPAQFPDPYFTPTQCCGAAHRGTDFVAMLDRQLLDYAKCQKLPAYFLCSDVCAAFYSVDKEFVCRDNGCDERIDARFARLGLPLVRCMNLQPPSKKALLRESHKATWFTTVILAGVVEIAIGSKPGDPFGNCILNFCYRNVLVDVSRQFEAEGLEVRVHWSGHRSLDPTPF